MSDALDQSPTKINVWLILLFKKFKKNFKVSKNKNKLFINKKVFLNKISKIVKIVQILKNTN